MDTKTLYDALVNAGISLDHQENDQLDDCIEVWILTALGDQEFMTDYLGDFLMELTTQEHIAAISSNATDALREHGNITPQQWQRFGIACAAGHLINTYCRSIGVSVIKVLEREARKVVLKEADQWWADCMGYHHDMQQGAREDAEYARREAQHEPF